jgi:molecular chaperone GrpE
MSNPGEQVESDQQGSAPVEPAEYAKGDAEAQSDAESRIVELEALAEERLDHLLRVQAELENQRRRSEREIEAAHKYAMERFAGELLNVCDSLEMGLEAARKTQDASSIIEGTALTLKAFHKAFDKFGIEAVDPRGERFDPERHQAMTTQESAGHPANTVLATLQKGYLLQGRVLRPAMVIVSRLPQNNGGEDA